MMQNPVFSREMKVNSRSVRLPVIILLFNGILSLVILLSMYSAAAQVGAMTAIQYDSFMDTYEFITIIEFMLLIFVMPTMTASSINGERGRQTPELMLTTWMTTFQVVIGKLMNALSTLLLLIVSNFPAVAMVFVYGDITWGGAVSLLLCYITVALFVGGMGLCFSALFKHSTISTVVTYGVLITVMAGIYFIDKFTLSLPSMNINNSVATYGLEENAIKATSGEAFYLLLPNPAATFLTILSGQVGGNAPLTKIRSCFGMTTTNFMTDNWIMVSILTQLALTILMVHITVRCVEPVKHRRKNGKKGVDCGNY